MGERKSVIIMVGLPARGKTFLAVRLKRYLEWQGYRTGIFNVGSYRRNILGPDSSRSDFFDPGAVEFARERERMAKKCFGDLSGWLESAGDIAIYDATNVTPARRKYLGKECLAMGFDHVFVENVCDDPEILGKIVNIKITRSADYVDKDAESAKEDFWRRIRHYEGVYETVEEDLPHIKIFNFGEKTNKNFEPSHGLFNDIAEFLGSINLAEKDVYVTRHGETFFNL